MQRPCLVALAAILTSSGCAGDGAPLTGGGGNSGAAGNGPGAAGTSGAAGNTGGSGNTGNTGGPGSAGNGTAGDSGTAGSSVTGTGGGPTVTPPKQALTAPDKCTSNVPGPRKLWRLSGPEFAASIRTIFNDTANAAPIAT